MEFSCPYLKGADGFLAAKLLTAERRGVDASGMHTSYYSCASFSGGARAKPYLLNAIALSVSLTAKAMRAK